jgi:hypothetical protein
MGLIKEAINIDLSTKSEPWSEKELVDFRKLMANIKAKNAIKASSESKKSKSPQKTINPNR